MEASSQCVLFVHALGGHGAASSRGSAYIFAVHARSHHHFGISYCSASGAGSHVFASAHIVLSWQQPA